MASARVSGAGREGGGAKCVCVCLCRAEKTEYPCTEVFV